MNRELQRAREASPLHERLKSEWHVFQKKHRKATGTKMTQRVAGELLGVTAQAVGHWLNGNEEIPDGRLVEFCRLMEIDPHFIKPEIPIKLTLTEEEEEVVRVYRSMPPELRASWTKIGAASLTGQTI